MNTSWQDLLVYGQDGERWADDLGELVRSAPANLDTATITDGRISEWPGFFIAMDGEIPDWDTPREPVNWDGFEEALRSARG